MAPPKEERACCRKHVQKYSIPLEDDTCQAEFQEAAPALGAEASSHDIRRTSTSNEG